MADIFEFLRRQAMAQYAKGAPYREAVGGLLAGDATKFGELAQEFNRKAQTPEGALDVALNFAPLGITAWHGSPKSFEKFDLSKAGTGVGNEYYGRGTYFTESPELAKSYAAPESLESLFAIGTVNDLKDAFNVGGIKKVNEYVKKNNLQEYAPKINDFFQSTVYKVDIPDKSLPKMLDFDKPLYRQSDEVKQLAMQYLPALKNRIKFTGDDSVWKLTGLSLIHI